jgi:hypothetical protein
MKIGFTGRADQVTIQQQDSLEKLLVYFRVRYGENIVYMSNDGEGADQLFAQTIQEYVGKKVVHTPVNTPMARNRDLVTAINILIAMPPANFFVKRSGTWATVRYALKAEKCVYLIQQDGMREKLYHLDDLSRFKKSNA